MPFGKLYAVNFANGNRHPHPDLEGWGDLLFAPPVSALLANSYGVTEGLVLELARGEAAGADAAQTALYLAPAGGIALDSRLLMRVTFDRPRAEGFPLDSHGEFAEEIERAQRSTGEEGRPARVAEIPGSAFPPDFGSAPGTLTVPESWAVALILSPGQDLAQPQMSIATCQFRTHGVRLNTPGSIQRDTAETLESPLDYDAYKGGAIALPDGSVGEFEAPLFTLEHSFSGIEPAHRVPTVDCGLLTISRSWLEPRRDHRLFSSDALTSPLAPSIGALGVALASLGVGRMTVRLRSFEVLRNPMP